VPAQTQVTVLHNFAAGSDGAEPRSDLIDVNGVLYGTTSYGGTQNQGTVFKITTSGAETVVYNFAGGSDGASPDAGLINVNGVLFGTTAFGGDANGDGTVFKLTTSGSETVLHTFGASNDGRTPEAGLTNVNGVLYGTTSSSAAHNLYGTVFKITTSGAETVLHSFTGVDGARPSASLTNVGGVLYSTTPSGGANGLGTVFEITTAGAESVLHSFSGDDGAQPYARLTDVNGVLYGTTAFGGVGGEYGPGTVFKITTAGTEQVLHSFKGGSDGKIPTAGLINVNGMLYGTTSSGGADPPNGTVFKITTSGTKTTLYRFVRAKAATGPAAGLTDVNGVLYGTNVSNGADNDGTVFSLSV
jgi:uncharacterized repeat protein (TIGR03803 family)